MSSQSVSDIDADGYDFGDACSVHTLPSTDDEAPTPTNPDANQLPLDRLDIAGDNGIVQQFGLAEFVESSSDSAGASSSSAGIPFGRSCDAYEFEEDDEDEDGQVCVLETDDRFVNGYARLGSGGSNNASSSCEAISECPPSGHSRSASGAVLTSLKKRWKGVKKASSKTAGKSLSTLSASLTTSNTRETREERHSRLGDEWLQIIPAWSKKRRSARVRTLVFRGIPANVRGRVWKCAIGNPLNVSKELFCVLKERAYKGRMEYMRGRETLALADGDVGGMGGAAEGMMESERSAHKAIMLDLPRTFPDLSFFHAEGSQYEGDLRDVLEAFLYLKPDVGYSQGMSFLGAVLLLYMDCFDAFSCFVNMLLHKSCFLHFFRIKMPEVRFYLSVHERLLQEEMPSLCTHFREQGIESDLYMINWVMSLYCRALPLDLVSRIWDLYVVDGDVAIFRSALGILKLFCPRLMKMKFEDLAYFLSHVPGEDIVADDLMAAIRSVRVVTKKRFKDLFNDCAAEHEKGESVGEHTGKG